VSIVASALSPFWAGCWSSRPVFVIWHYLY